MSKLGDELVEAMRQAAAHARGENVPGARVHRIPVDVPNVRVIRRRLHLSQREFSDRFGLDKRAVQDWEQGRRRPERAAITLLRTIERHPDAVADAARVDL